MSHESCVNACEREAHMFIPRAARPRATAHAPRGPCVSRASSVASETAWAQRQRGIKPYAYLIRHRRGSCGFHFEFSLFSHVNYTVPCSTPKRNYCKVHTAAQAAGRGTAARWRDAIDRAAPSAGSFGLGYCKLAGRRSCYPRSRRLLGGGGGERAVGRCEVRQARCRLYGQRRGSRRL